MIRNYNGNVNRTVIRGLRKLCYVNAENEKNLFNAFAQKGKVSVYENPDPFTGFPDEMSTVVTMRSKTEVKEYLKKDFLRRIEGYLSSKKPAEDYLLSALIEFVKENSRFPEKDAMRQLEKNAEEKRIADLPSDTITTPKEITEQDIAKEILELSEEIIEARRERKPEDIFVHVEPYKDELLLSDNDFSLCIHWDRYYGRGNCSDYSCVVTTNKNKNYNKVFFQYQYDGTTTISAEKFDRRITTLSLNTLIDIHKFVVEMAKAEGIEFISEIDYEKFPVT